MTFKFCQAVRQYDLCDFFRVRESKDFNSGDAGLCCVFFQYTVFNRKRHYLTLLNLKVIAFFLIIQRNEEKRKGDWISDFLSAAAD